MKATPIQPTGIPKGQPFWRIDDHSGYEPTYNFGTDRDWNVKKPSESLRERQMYDYASTKRDKQ